jgi:uncharacterized protein (UPF0333 family)
MLKLYTRARNAILALHRREEAQDGFEYLLVIGVVMVAVVAAIASGVAGDMATAVIDAVQAALEAAI